LDGIQVGLIFSSDVREILEISDRILIMLTGLIVSGVLPQEVLEQGLLDLMLGVEGG